MKLAQNLQVSELKESDQNKTNSNPIFLEISIDTDQGKGGFN